jgi:hypothetical protein
MVKFLRSALFNGLLCHVYTRNIACIYPLCCTVRCCNSAPTAQLVNSVASNEKFCRALVQRPRS